MLNFLNIKISGLRDIWRFNNRWQLLWNRLFFRRYPLNVYQLDRLEFLVDHAGGDPNGTRALMVTDMYRCFLPFMNLPQELTFFDLGANGGGFPLMLSAEGYQFIHGGCVEMNPNTYQRLLFNMNHNFGDKITCLNAAVCGQSGMIQAFLGRGSTGDSLYATPSTVGPDRSSCAIKTLTFDEAWARCFPNPSNTVDLCKMDIESAEFKVFSNLGHDRIRQCRYVLMEIHKTPRLTDKTDLFNELNNMGFAPVNVPERENDDVVLFKKN